MADQHAEVVMSARGHGGARAGAGRKPQVDRKVKRSVTLSTAADAIVRSARQAEETYSQTLDRLLCATLRPADRGAPVAADVGVLVQTLMGTREPMAVIYRRLGWTRQVFERLVQTHRSQLAGAGVRLHVATKDAASGRREKYITVDGVRYSAMSRDLSSGQPASHPDAAG